MRCRLVEKQERIWNSDRAEMVVQTTYTLLVLPETDLHELDRITDVTFEDGATANADFIVKSLTIRRGRVARHKSAQLEVLAWQGS